MNNADFGITIQKSICDKFSLELGENANNQFNSGYNEEYKDLASAIIEKVFNQLELSPVVCLTYSTSPNGGERFNPHNFILNDGSTLSIRTNKKGDKVSPRVVGQAGYDKLNYHFGIMTDEVISDQGQIKHLVYNKIDLMLPIFLDYLFISDYTVWIFLNDKDFGVEVIDRNSFVDMSFNRDKFTFTRELVEWNESVTLKYDSISIAEIQVHKNRTFKLRFQMNNLIMFIRAIKLNNETIGMTAEKSVCDIFDLEYDDSLKKRSYPSIQRELEPILKKAFKNLPKPKKHTGSKMGERGGQSKSSYDFILEDGSKLSLKTNKSKICPPEVGQPGAITCYSYFGDFMEDDEINEITFKKLVLTNVVKMVPIYIEHLFDSDYLLWINKRKDSWNYKVLPKELAERFEWENDKFAFTKSTLEDWNESTTLKYDGVSIGEFQVHRGRECYKFRFIMDNLMSLI